MATALPDHLTTKVHPLRKKPDWNKILIASEPERSICRVSNSSNEKNDSLFDWMRPTVSVIDRKTLQLHASSGRDYVQHHASIVANHFALKDGNLSVMKFAYPTPP